MRLPWLDIAVPVLGRFGAVATPWIALGANVLPIPPGGKTPAVAGWGKRGARWHSEDSDKIPRETIAQWSREFRDLNVAILPATIGAHVVDVDDPSRLDAVLDVCGPTAYRTFSGRAGGGVHLWYSDASGSRNAICRGVDIKSNGGYVLAPGSIHAKTGAEYGASIELVAALAAGRLDLPASRRDWWAGLVALGTSVREPSRIELQALVDQMQARVQSRTWARVLRSVAEGRSFAEPGERDTVLFHALRELSRAWPHATVESIQALFAPSGAVMDTDDFDLEDAIEEKWSRLTADIVADETEADERTRALRRLAWQWVRADSDESAYRDDGPIVLHAGKSYYLRIGADYAGPWTRDELTPDVLATIGAVYETEIPDVPQLLARFGARVADLRTSLSAERTTYDVQTGRLEVAAAPLRSDLTPAHSAAVDAVLREIGGEYYPQLTWWVAGLLRLEEPCRALILSGEGGRGKSMLLDGLGRLWPHGAAKLRDVLGRRFNSALTMAALAVSDDDSSSAENGEALAAFLREGVHDRVQRLERKHHDVVTVDGSMRYALATNDPFALVSGAVSYRMNHASLEAFGQRLCHVPVPSAAAGCWSRAGVTPGQLVQGDIIARHALWLRDATAQAAPVDRFWVGPGDDDLARLAVLSSGLRGDVLVRIATALEGAPAHGGLGGGLGAWISVGAGSVHVSPSVMLASWDRPPRGASERTIGMACKALAEASVCEQPAYRGGARVRAIDLDLVLWYAERAGV